MGSEKGWFDNCPLAVADFPIHSRICKYHSFLVEVFPGDAAPSHSEAPAAEAAAAEVPAVAEDG